MTGANAYHHATRFARDLLIAVENAAGHHVLRERLAAAAVELLAALVAVLDEASGTREREELRRQVRTLRVMLVLARDLAVLGDGEFRNLARRLESAAHGN